MNLGLGVALAGLLCACRGVDTVGIVVLGDAGTASLPVLPAAAGIGAGASAGAQSSPNTQPAGSVADAGTAPTDKEPNPGPSPLAAGSCSVGASDACTRARVAAFTHALCSCGNVIGPSGFAVYATPGSSPAPVGVNGMLLVDGDLHPPDSAMHPGMSAPISATPPRPDDRPLQPACACGPGVSLDVVGLVNDAVQHNDNAAQGVDSEALASSANAAALLDLGCGRFSLHGVNVRGDLRLRVRGHALVYVASDFIVQGDVQVELAADAELDLLISGSLIVRGSARFADADHAAQARIYVGAQLAVSASPDRAALPRPAAALGEAVLVGNFYAPNAVLQLAAATDLYGSLFVAELLLLQNLSIHSASPAVGGSCGF